MNAQPPRIRYQTLDGMRGMAALAVALYHFGLFRDHWFARGYLAVDLFFALSGFVIALKYAPRLASDLSAWKFLEIRLVRLYPLYFAGLALGGVITMIAKLHFQHGNGIASLLAKFLLASAMIPDVFRQGSLFPLNIPAWSLFFELLVNVLFAFFLVHWRSRSIVVVIMLAGAAIIAVTGPPTYLDMGAAWSSSIGGLARTAFSFCVGMIIARHGSNDYFPKSWASSIPVAILIAVLAYPLREYREIVEPMIVILLFPALIIAGIRLEPPKVLARIFGFLGDISYSVYAIHSPVLGIVTYLTSKFRLSTPIAGCIFLALVVSGSIIAVRFFDEPTRRKLTQALRVKRSPSVASLT